MIKEKIVKWSHNHPRATNAIAGSILAVDSTFFFYVAPFTNEKIPNFEYLLYWMGFSTGVYATSRILKAIKPELNILDTAYGGLKHLASRVEECGSKFVNRTRKLLSTDYVEQLGYKSLG